MDTNRNFRLWFDLLPEMRQEIRARMPNISRFMLASTCKHELASTDKKSLIPTKGTPLTWQLRQAIIEDMEPLFEWLIQSLRSIVDKYTTGKPLSTVWTGDIGTAIGKSGNLKWWADDRLCAMLPRYITGVAAVALKDPNYSIPEAPLAFCRMCHVPYIVHGLTKNGHRNAFFDLHRMVTENRFKLDGNDGYYSHEDYQSQFLLSAARHGRLEWLQELITPEFLSDNVHSPKVERSIISGAVIDGQLHVLKWCHSLIPNWFQRTDEQLYRQVLKGERLSTEKLIEVIAWLYTVALHPLYKDFLIEVVHRYLRSRGVEDRWKLLEFVRSMNKFACDKFNMSRDTFVQLHSLVGWIKRTRVKWLELPQWRNQSEHPEWETPWDDHPDLPAIPTIENMLDWIDTQITKGRNNIKGH